MSLFHSPGMVTNGLVMYLDAANVKSHSQSGGGFWNDAVGGFSGNQAGNAIWASGAVNFSGTGYVLGPVPPILFDSGSSFSQAAWFRKSGTGTDSPGWQAIFSAHTGSTGGDRYIMTFGNGSVDAPFNSVGLNRVGVAATGIFLDIGSHLDRWLNATIVKNGNNISIYCFNNGTLIKKSQDMFWSLSASGGYFVGRHWGGGSITLLTGSVATISVWNRALSESEIIQNYNALRGRFGL